MKHPLTISTRNPETPEYTAWRAMRRRCYDTKHKSYKDYGGRGLQVDEKWRDDFYAFLSDVGPKPTLKHTLERIENHKNYEPGNVRWATRAEQNANRRNTHRIELNGRTMHLVAWARWMGISRARLKRRLEFLPIEHALDPNYPMPRRLEKDAVRTPLLLPTKTAA